MKPSIKKVGVGSNAYILIIIHLSQWKAIYLRLSSKGRKVLIEEEEGDFITLRAF